jgi:SNF2 family DNA or RNA helicase
LDFEDAFGYGGIEKDEAYYAARFGMYFGVNRAEQEARAELLYQDPGILQLPGLRVPLYPYQARAVRFLHRAGSGILGDEPGLGKTLQALAWTLLSGGRTLVVCPAGVVGVWLSEVATKTHLTVAPLRGTTTEEVPVADVVVVPNSVVHSHLERLGKAGFTNLVVDEAHTIKNPTSQRSRAVTALAGKVARRLLMSGSLVLRSNEDLYPVVRLVHPYMPGLKAFRERYCTVKSIRIRRRVVQTVVSSQRGPELRQRLEPWMASRRLAEVVSDLPELREQAIHIELMGEALERYRTCIKRMRSETRGSTGSLEAFREATVALQTAKTSAALEVLEDLRPTDRKVLAFSHHLAPLDALETKPWGEVAIRLTGSVPPAERTLRVAAFQTDPRIRLALCQLQAAGTGITLDAADTVLMVDPGWVPALVDQAIRRARRVTTRHPVMVYHFVVRGTLDEARWARLSERRGALDAMHGEDLESSVYETAMRELHT